MKLPLIEKKQNEIPYVYSRYFDLFFNSFVCKNSKAAMRKFWVSYGL